MRIMLCNWVTKKSIYIELSIDPRKDEIIFLDGIGYKVVLVEHSIEHNREQTLRITVIRSANPLFQTLSMCLPFCNRSSLPPTNPRGWFARRVESNAHLKSEGSVLDEEDRAGLLTYPRADHEIDVIAAAGALNALNGGVDRSQVAAVFGMAAVERAERKRVAPQVQPQAPAQPRQNQVTNDPMPPRPQPAPLRVINEAGTKPPIYDRPKSKLLLHIVFPWAVLLIFLTVAAGFLGYY